MTEKSCITISQLGPFDVLCGRDKKCSSNLGNRQFRALINQHVQRYLDCESKFERSKAIGAIVKELVENPQGSVRFFKRVKGCSQKDDEALLEQLDEKQSREKVAHALRDYASQRRNNQKKERSLSPPRIAQQNAGLDPRIFPGSNSPEGRLRGQTVNINTNLSHAQMRKLMEEEARLSAQIEALEQPINTSSSSPAVYQGSVNYAEPIRPGHANNHLGTFDGTANHSQNAAVSNYNQQSGHYQHEQYYLQQQQQQQQRQHDEENEGSENYDDFNIEEYNQFIKPLGSSIRSVDAPAGTVNNEVLANNPNHTASGNRHYRLQPLKDETSDYRLTPLKGDEASEGYDAFDERIEPLRGGSSTRKRESFEKNGSSLRNRDSFEKNGSNRSVKSQGSLRHQGSLRQIDVFEKSGNSRLSMNRSHDSLGATDLMLMSMETLTLGESDMLDQSGAFGDSVLSFDQSKLDFSMQQSKLDMSMQQSKLDMSMQQSKLDMSKLDMSVQTLDTADFLGEKRSTS